VAGFAMADTERGAREAHVAQTLARLKEIDKIPTAEGRLQAIHNELFFALDRIVNEQRTIAEQQAKPANERPRFNGAETEILLSLALQTIAIMDSASRPKPGWVGRAREDWAQYKPVTKWTLVLSLIGALIAGAYAVFHDYIHDYIWKPEAPKPAVSAPPPAATSLPPAKPNSSTPHS
jgi:hypothetical protein